MAENARWKLGMKKLVILATLVLTGCGQPLPEGQDNTTDLWERIAEVPSVPGVYKVIDTEDGVICYYVIGGSLYNEGPNSISCLAAHF